MMRICTSTLLLLAVTACAAHAERVAVSVADTALAAPAPASAGLAALSLLPVAPDAGLYCAGWSDEERVESLEELRERKRKLEDRIEKQRLRQHIGRLEAQQRGMALRPPKSPFLAGFLNFLLPGVGSLYCGAKYVVAGLGEILLYIGFQLGWVYYKGQDDADDGQGLVLGLAVLHLLLGGVDAFLGAQRARSQNEAWRQAMEGSGGPRISLHVDPRRGREQVGLSVSLRF